MRAGKRVRHETAIGDGALSASYAALELARKIFGSLAGRRVLVIGTGEIGLHALENLQGVETGGLVVMNRTRARADEFAERFGAEVREFEKLEEVLVDIDFVISSTSSQSPLIDLDGMRRVRHRRGGNRPLLIVDLAVPRDFHPSCGKLDEIFLENLEDLRGIMQQNAEGRQRELPKAEAIVETELETFFEWLFALDVEPTIRKLRERFHAIRDEELERLHGIIDEEALSRVDEFARRLVNRLLHIPSENLRRHRGLRDWEFMAVVHELLTEEISHRKAREEDQ